MKILLVPFILIAGIYSCSAYDLGSQRPTEITVNTVNPTWDGGVKAVIQARCDNCHSEKQSKFVPGTVKKYNFGLSKSETEFNSKYLSGSNSYVFNNPTNPMPPKYADELYPAEKAALKAYFDSKLSVNQFDIKPCPTNITTTTLTFDADIKSIGDANCKTCHNRASGAAAGGGRIVETKDDYKQYRNSLAQYMTGTHAGTFKFMPPGSKLPAADSAKILEWACFSSEAK